MLWQKSVVVLIVHDRPRNLCEVVGPRKRWGPGIGDWQVEPSLGRITVFIRGLIRSIILYQLPDHGPGNRYETIDLGLKKLIFALKLLILPKIGRTTQSRLTFLSLNHIRVMISKSRRIDWEPPV